MMKAYPTNAFQAPVEHSLLLLLEVERVTSNTRRFASYLLSSLLTTFINKSCSREPHTLMQTWCKSLPVSKSLAHYIQCKTCLVWFLPIKECKIFSKYSGVVPRYSSKKHPKVVYIVDTMGGPKELCLTYF